MPPTPAAIRIDRAPVLLFDDALTARKRGFVLTLNPMTRDPAGPVIAPDRPWERRGIVGDSNVSVIEESGLIRLWYVIADPRPHAAPRPAVGDVTDLDAKTRADAASDTRYVLCYAESDDGLRWRKPELDILPFEGRPTNMLLAGRMGATVFLDPAAPPAQRYKLIHGFGPRLPQVYRHGDGPTRLIFHGIYGSSSPDGLRWTTHPEPIMPWYTDTTNAAYWDTRLGRYVAFCRWNENLGFRDNQTVILERGAEHYRAIGRSESRDFFRFPPPRKIAEPSPAERRPRATGMDYYNTSAVKYPDVPDAYLMFSCDFHHDSDALDVHLATSRDGARYTRWKEPLLRLGPDGAFDCRQVYMGSGIVRRGPEAWMYYHGRAYGHGDRSRREGPAGGIGLARIRAEGFVSQDAPAEGGSLLTRPLRLPAAPRALRVNADASAGGWLRVELCDATGRALSGHTLRASDPLRYNQMAGLASWRGSTALANLPRIVRLRFTGRSVKLYAFEFLHA